MKQFVITQIAAMSFLALSGLSGTAFAEEEEFFLPNHLWQTLAGRCAITNCLSPATKEIWVLVIASPTIRE
jgi:hypothetical protein